MPPFALSCLLTFAVATPLLASEDGLRTLVVREKTTASLAGDRFSFKVVKLKGYSVDIRTADGKRTLKLGDSFGPADASCTVKFEEISPETRIARFKTDCP